MNKIAENWFTRHNPAVLFDKDTWKGVGYTAKEGWNSAKQLGSYVKRNYWNNALGDKNFYKNIVQERNPYHPEWQDEQAANMGNAAINAPLSAVANAIPNAYNIGAGAINLGLGIGSKILTNDITTKGPRLPYAGQWYTGRDYFEGGNPNVSQNSAGMSSAATAAFLGSKLGPGFSKSVNSVTTKPLVAGFKAIPRAWNNTVNFFTDSDGGLFSPRQWATAFKNRGGGWDDTMPNRIVRGARKSYLNMPTNIRSVFNNSKTYLADNTILPAVSPIIDGLNTTADIVASPINFTRKVITNPSAITRDWAQRFASSGYAPKSFKRRWVRYGNRVSAVKDDIVNNSIDPLKSTVQIDNYPGQVQNVGDVFGGFGINPDDWEFAGNFSGTSGAPKVSYLGATKRLSSGNGANSSNQWRLRSRFIQDRDTGDLIPYTYAARRNDRNLFLGDKQLKQDNDTLFKGLSPVNKTRAAGVANRTDNKVLSGGVQFSTQDPGLAYSYDPRMAVIDPSVAVKNPAGKPVITRHLGEADPNVVEFWDIVTPAERSRRVPRNDVFFYGEDRIYHPNATETLITPAAGSDSYITDLIAPTFADSRGNLFSHWRRKSGGSRIHPTYVDGTEKNARHIGYPVYPSSASAARYTPVQPEELNRMRMLNHWFGLGSNNNMVAKEGWW